MDDRHSSCDLIHGVINFLVGIFGWVDEQESDVIKKIIMKLYMEHCIYKEKLKMT